MTDLTISEDLAAKLHSIAERENRPIEAVLYNMVNEYSGLHNITDLENHLAALGIISLPSNETSEMLLTEEEQVALADRIGAMGSLSDLIIQERRESD
jgi:hypothetical protein